MNNGSTAFPHLRISDSRGGDWRISGKKSNAILCFESSAKVAVCGERKNEKAMSFWGLYGGLEDKLKGSKDTNASTNSTPTAGFTSSSVLDGEPATKKRKLDVPSGLVPRCFVFSFPRSSSLLLLRLRPELVLIII